MLDTTWKGWGSRIPGRKDHILKKGVPVRKKNNGGGNKISGNQKEISKK
jgi:hypothetical protein